MKRLTLTLSVLFLAVAILAIPLTAQASEQLPPQRTIPVTGNGLVKLAAGHVNVLQMRSGDEIAVPNLAAKNVKASVAAETKKTLPAALPEDVHFVDALSISLVQDGKILEMLPTTLSVSFAEDAEYISCESDRSIVILRWDDVQGWMEIAKHTLETTSNLPGLFVLAVK